MQLVEIIFNDEPSKKNKELTDFIGKNLVTIIKKGQIQFKFKIAQTADITTLHKRGIKELPVMIGSNNNTYIGVKNIINTIADDVSIKRFVMSIWHAYSEQSS